MQSRSCLFICEKVVYNQKNEKYRTEVCREESMSTGGVRMDYMKMYEVCQDPQLKTYFRNKLEKARLMLNNIEQRRKTILTISRSGYWRRSI